MSEVPLQAPHLKTPLQRPTSARYKGTSLIRKHPPLGPYSKDMPRPLWRSKGERRFVISEVPLYLQNLAFSIQEQQLCRNVNRFRDGLVSKAHGLVNHSTLGWRVIKQREKNLARKLLRRYKATSLIRNTHPPRITIGPWA